MHQKLCSLAGNRYAPGQDDRVVGGDVLVAPCVLIDVPAGMVVVRHEGKCPPRKNIFAGGGFFNSSADMRDPYLPDGFVALCILYARSVAVLCDIAIYVFHQQIRREDAVQKISTDIFVVKVVLEQRRDLPPDERGDSEKLAHEPRPSTHLLNNR